MMSMAVRRVCFRDGTYTIVDFVLEWRMIAWYTGFTMASSRDWLCVMLKPYRQIFSLCKWRQLDDSDPESLNDSNYLDVQLKGYWAHSRQEAEYACITTAQPASYVLGVTNGYAESNDTDVTFDLRRDVPHPRADNFQHGLKSISTTIYNAEDDVSVYICRWVDKSIYITY